MTKLPESEPPACYRCDQIRAEVRDGVYGYVDPLSVDAVLADLHKEEAENV